MGEACSTRNKVEKCIRHPSTGNGAHCSATEISLLSSSAMLCVISVLAMARLVMGPAGVHWLHMSRSFYSFFFVLLA